MVALRRRLIVGSLALVAGLTLGLRLLHAQTSPYGDGYPTALPPSATTSGGLTPLPAYTPPAIATPPAYTPPTISTQPAMSAPLPTTAPMNLTLPPTATAPMYTAPMNTVPPSSGIPSSTVRQPAADYLPQTTAQGSYGTVPTTVPMLASRAPAAAPNILPPANNSAAPPMVSSSTPGPNLPSYTAPAMAEPELTNPSSAANAKPGQTIVRDVRVEGNHTTAMSKLPKLSTRVGQPFDPRLVQEDVRSLASSRKFLDVRSQFQSVPDGIIVIFQVVERPTVGEVNFVGNQDVRTQTLRKKSELEKGQPLDPYAVEEARRRLESYYHEKGYNHAVITTLEGDKPNDHGATFLVDEGQSQRVLWVSFQGNTITSSSRLRTQIAIKPGVLWLFGGKVDRKKIDDDVQKLLAYYRGLGFFRAKISPDLNYNGDKDWLSLTYVIDEGPRFKIRNVSFIGNEKFKGVELNKGLEQISGKDFNQTTLDHDLAAIRDVYGTHGYIFSDIQAETRLLEDQPEMDLVYNIAEGKRYRVGKINVNISGDDQHTKHTVIYDRLSLHPGDIVDTKKIREDERRLRATGIFNVDPTKGGAPKIAFTKPDANPDDAEQVAQRPGSNRGNRIGVGIGSGSPDNSGSGSSGAGYGGSGSASGGYNGYRGQSPDDDEVIVDISSAKDEAGNNLIVFTPSQESVRSISDREIQQARFQSPGSGFGGATTSAANTNSDWSGYSTPSGNQSRGAWNIGSGSSTPNYLPPGAQPLSPSSAMAPSSPATLYGPPPVGSAPAMTGTLPSTTSPYSNASYPGGSTPAYNAQYQNPPPVSGTLPPPTGSYPAAPTYTAPPYTPPAAQPGYTPSAAPPAYAQSQPSYPPGFATSGGNAFGPSYTGSGGAPPPAYGAPPTGYGAPPPGYGMPPGIVPPPAGSVGYQTPEGDPIADLNVTAQETMTGRLMIGAGINSDAGLVGNFVLDEQNFDIMRLPRSWDDVTNGTAWRGGSEQFRLEADPGTELQRYAATFRDNYIFDTPIQFSISAYYFTRIYESWTEGRVGGTTSLGYAFAPDLTGTIGFRGEQVQIYNPVANPPPQLKEVLGNNNLEGFSVGMAHDTRDSPFLPTEGHLVSATFEEVVGSFTYPRVDVQGQQYFTLHQRADGSGRQVLGIGGQLDISGNNTPIYDAYFAGGFSTLRGFAFRGVTPRAADGVGVGGDFMALGTVEYLFPITADDALRGVFFCDFGTVEPDVRWGNVRVAPGFGLRINVPAMGPAPIALDIAFPVSRAPGDEVQNFSFFVGIGR